MFLFDSFCTPVQISFCHILTDVVTFVDVNQCNEGNSESFAREQVVIQFRS